MQVCTCLSLSLFLPGGRPDDGTPLPLLSTETSLSLPTMPNAGATPCVARTTPSPQLGSARLHTEPRSYPATLIALASKGMAYLVQGYLSNHLSNYT